MKTILRIGYDKNNAFEYEISMDAVNLKKEEVKELRQVMIKSIGSLEILFDKLEIDK